MRAARSPYPPLALLCLLGLSALPALGEQMAERRSRDDRAEAGELGEWKRVRSSCDSLMAKAQYALAHSPPPATKGYLQNALSKSAACVKRLTDADKKDARALNDAGDKLKSAQGSWNVAESKGAP